MEVFIRMQTEDKTMYRSSAYMFVMTVYIRFKSLKKLCLLSAMFLCKGWHHKSELKEVAKS